MIRVKLVAWSCVVALAAAGCGGGTTHEKEYFILEAARPRGPVQARTDATLEVRRLSIDSAFAARNLVYRLGEFEYEADNYRQFMIAPAVMISERTRDWLADSGLFARVTSAGGRLEAQYALDGSVLALYGDFSDEAVPAAVVKIRYFLLGRRDGQESVLFGQTYGVATPVASRTADDFVAALDAGLVAILTQLEADLEKVLAAGAAEAAPNP